MDGPLVARPIVSASTAVSASTPVESDVSVVTIDGPSGAGKGTIAMQLARQLNFHLLDSGAVYRAAAVLALSMDVDLSSEAALVSCVQSMQARFLPAGNQGVVVFVNDKNVTQEIRTETTAAAASSIAVMPRVRQALLSAQRDFRKPPGLVADGRDMGTVVFPEAILKIFLTASVEERAERRLKQLNQQGIRATMEGLLQELETRDLRDSTRKTAPLVPAEDALVIDSTGISAGNVMARVTAEFDLRTGASG